MPNLKLPFPLIKRREFEFVYLGICKSVGIINYLYRILDNRRLEFDINRSHSQLEL